MFQIKVERFRGGSILVKFAFILGGGAKKI